MALAAIYENHLVEYKKIKESQKDIIVQSQEESVISSLLSLSSNVIMLFLRTFIYAKLHKPEESKHVLKKSMIDWKVFRISEE
jgi:small-conductance mechanosensitive channel